MNPDFRKATLYDFDDILLLKRQVHDFHHKNRPDFYKAVTSPLEKNEYESFLTSNESEVYVLEFSGKICGYAFVKIIKFKDNPLINDHTRFYIEDICIDESFRKKGFGKFFMRELENECKSKGIKFMDLTVWKFNDEAFDFYRRNGMKEIMARMEKRIE